MQVILKLTKKHGPRKWLHNSTRNWVIRCFRLIGLYNYEIAQIWSIVLETLRHSKNNVSVVALWRSFSWRPGMTWYLSSDRYHWYLSDIYLISIKQEINVDFLHCIEHHLAMLHYWSLCSPTEFNFCFRCFKMPGRQKLGEKPEKNSRFATVHWIDELMWPRFLSWFCFVLALWEKSEDFKDFKDFIDFRNQIDIR